MSYGEKIEEQRVITSERFHAKSYDGINYSKEQKNLSIPLAIFKEHTEDKEKRDIRKKRIQLCRMDGKCMRIGKVNQSEFVLMEKGRTAIDHTRFVHRSLKLD